VTGGAAGTVADTVTDAPAGTVTDAAVRYARARATLKRAPCAGPSLRPGEGVNAVGVTTVGVSIAVPEPYGRLLQESRASFGDPAAYAIPTHVTLLPPTEIPAGEVPVFGRHLARVAAATRPFVMRLHGTDTFRPLSPVVYVRVAEGGPNCAVLQERVRSGPVTRDLQFPYHPHVTVAHGTAEAAMDRAQREPADFAAAWTAIGFALYEQGADGVWRPTRDFHFGGSGPGSSGGGGGSGGKRAAVPHQHGVRTASRL
jgi:2'-5' RNA ligase